MSIFIAHSATGSYEFRVQAIHGRVMDCEQLFPSLFHFILIEIHLVLHHDCAQKMRFWLIDSKNRNIP